MKKVIISALIIASVGIIKPCSAQDISALLDVETSETTDYTLATFLGNRVVNGQSSEQLQRNGLDFRIAHRFGSFKEGKNELFGFDESNSYFTIDYGLSNRIMIGLGRATDNKLVTANIKAKLLRQSSGKKTMPVTLSFWGGISATTQKFSNKERNDDFNSRLEYTGQLLIARKFNNLSILVSPTYLHRNLVDKQNDANDLAALGLSGRYKISSVFDVALEYFWVNQPKNSSTAYYNPLSLALSYQVSHHVFQVVVSNSHAIAENSVIGRTVNSWAKGDIRLGFNISTVF